MQKSRILDLLWLLEITKKNGLHVKLSYTHQSMGKRSLFSSAEGNMDVYFWSDKNYPSSSMDWYSPFIPSSSSKVTSWEELNEFYTCTPYDPYGQQEWVIRELKKQLENELPDYALPSHYFPISVLPTLPNGKLDRKGLTEYAEFQLSKDAQSKNLQQSKSASPLERSVIEIWENILDLKGIGLNESFQQLGGNSILLNFLQSKIQQQFGTSISFRDLWALNTVKTLSNFISEKIIIDKNIPQNESSSSSEN